MKLYAYCLSDEVEEDEFEAVEGINGAAARLLESEGIKAVVSDFPESSVAVTRENVLAHERVVRHVLRNSSLLPFRFGTVVGETRLLDFISAQRSALLSQLERVRGCLEMSVKIMGDKVEEAAREEFDEGVAVERSGTNYLEKKRREILGDSAMKARAEEVESWLSSRLRDVVRESVVTTKASGSLILSASYLVERVLLDEYRKSLEEARTERSDLHFLTSGPWPPYSFSNINS